MQSLGVKFKKEISSKGRNFNS